MSNENPEPILRLTLRNPTLDSVALLVELADHINVAGETQVIPETVYDQPGSISIEVPTHTVWIPTVDFDAEEEND